MGRGELTWGAGRGKGRRVEMPSTPAGEGGEGCGMDWGGEGCRV